MARSRYKLPPLLSQICGLERAQSATAAPSPPLTELTPVVEKVTEEEEAASYPVFEDLFTRMCLKVLDFLETESLVTFLLKMLHISISDWSAAFL